MGKVWVKELTGDATLKARRMREDFWEFPRTNKLILVTNHKPRVETGGDGMWRRLRLVPFAQKFWLEARGESGPAELKADLTLPAKLLRERSGLLAWLIRGAVAVHQDGMRLGPCKVIDNATRLRTKNGIRPETEMSLDELFTLYGETYRVYRRKPAPAGGPSA